MAFTDYFLNTITKKYAVFKGRATRSEYWFFMLFMWLILIAIVQIMGFFGKAFVAHKAGIFVFIIFYLALLLPSLAVTVRRLHDTGNSGWMILIRIIPIIGGLIIFIFTLMDSNPVANKYGKNPHLIEENLVDHLIEEF